MGNLTLDIRHDIRDWIESRVARGEFASAADYLSELVSRDRDSRSEEERIEEIRRMLEEAEASDVSDRTLEDIFAEGERRARQRGIYRE